MINPTKIADKAVEVFDDNNYSQQERDATTTERQRIDMTSPFKLPNIIRPIAFIWAMSLDTILSISVIVLAFMSDPVDTESVMTVVAGNALILITIVTWYFNSRKLEKINAKKMAADVNINAKKMEAAIKIEELKAKQDLKIDKKRKKIELKRSKD